MPLAVRLCRLLMFHATFLGMVGKPEGCSIGEVMYRLVSRQLHEVAQFEGSAV